MDEFDISMKLAMYAFQMKLPPEQLEAARGRFKPENVWGVFEEGDLQAQLTIIPLQLYVQGRALDMGGIAGVSSWPEHRRQGHVARLISHALEQMRARGQSVSCLAPFSFGFYRKYGYETYTEYKKYTVEAPMFPPRTASALHVTRISEEEIPQLSGIYERYASRYNGTLKRDEAWWKTSVLRRKKGNAAVCRRPDGEPAGYMLYEVADRLMTVHEMVFEDEEARRALWTFIANHDSMIDKAVLEAPMDDALPYLLPNPRIGQEVVPYFMARIVDAAAFAGQYAFAPGKEATRLTVELSDRHAEWNEGIWRLAVAPDGSGSLERENSGEAPRLACDINTWTALLMGYLRPLQLHGFGKLTGSPEAAARLEAIIPSRQTYLLDFF